MKLINRLQNRRAFLIASVCVVLLVLISPSVVRLQSQSNDRRQEGGQVPVVVEQLPQDNDIIPVELQCKTFRRAASDEVLILTCVLKNNTGKPISALSLAYSVTFERNGAEFSDSGNLTRDALIHPDFYESNARKFIPPGGEQEITRGEPIQHEDATAKRIEAVIDYVEFADKSSLGPDSEGSGLITQIREGAAKYRGWLKRKYVESGGSIDSLSSLLQDTSPLPAELKIEETMLAVGAEAYRKYARDLYKTGEREKLEKYLKDKNSEQ